MGDFRKTITRMVRFGARSLIAGLLLFGLALSTGCGLVPSGKAKAVVKECIVPTDQKDTLAGKWKVLAIPIAFHQGDFDAEEMTAITAAADTWNTFYNASRGLTVLDTGGATPRTSAQTVPTNTCAQGLIVGGKFTGQVVIYKQRRWPYPSTVNSTIALTNFCTTPATPLPSTYMAYMELNYNGFFAEGLKVPDLQTIMTHEFGHLLGLYHSCDTSPDKPGKPNCTQWPEGTEYNSALMFPAFNFYQDNTGIPKRELTENDQGRANCLYEAATTTTTTTK